MCCGRGRMAYRMASQPALAPVAAPVAVAAAVAAEMRTPPAPAAEVAVGAVVGRSAAVTLRYLGRGAARVMGPVTGRRYDVSPDRPTLAVEPRDAAVLLRQGVFGRA